MSPARIGVDQCGLWDAERGEQPTKKKVNEDTKEEPDETKTKEPLVVLSSGLYRDVDWRGGWARTVVQVGS